MDMQMLQALQQSSKSTLCEFKAGIMNFDGKMVTPDRRKGKVKLEKDMQTGMNQFQFFYEDSREPQENLIVFPGDAKFEKVKQTTDRVYLLEYPATQQRYFFWMQEPDKENDAERAKKMHNAMNGIEEAAGGGQQTVSTGSGPAPAMSGAQQQFGAGQNQVNAAQQQNFMQQFMQMQQMMQQAQQPKSPGISATITPEALNKLIEDMSPEEKKALTEHLPEGQQTDEHLKENLKSPQLRQAMQALTEAIQQSEENVQMILAMCDLDQDALTGSQDGMEALIKAFVKKYKKD